MRRYFRIFPFPVWVLWLLLAARIAPAASIGIGKGMCVGCDQTLAIRNDSTNPKVKVDKVLFLGNSITLHGPAPAIGWHGNWGMAASASDRDYVHLVLKGLAEVTGKQPRSEVANVADFERKYETYNVDSHLKKELAFQADLVIVAIGENVPALLNQEKKAAFQASMARLLRKFKENGKPIIVVRSCFWPDRVKDTILEQACKEVGGIFVDIGPLGKERANAARSERPFSHEGVAGHPGDRGMKAIAEAILKALKENGHFGVAPPESGKGVQIPQHTLGVLGACQGSSLEKLAAFELASYASRLVRTAVKIGPEGVCTIEGTGLRFLIGRGELLRKLETKQRLKVPKDLGEEGFLIKSVEDEGRHYVVFLGGSARGTLYAVYHYLERFCRVGFFNDGEQIPRLAALPWAGIDVIERPRWPIRQYMMDCEYTSYWWDWGQWKAEVDWACRRRFNVLSSNFDFTATWRTVWKRFGVEVPPGRLSGPPFHPWAGWHNWAIRPPYPVAFQNFQADLARRFTDYGRSLGIKMAPDFRGFIGQVPREFQKVYQGKARFLEAGWGGFEPPGVFLHPDDPLYLQVARAYAEEYLKRFGTDHLWASQSYCEMRPGKTPQEILTIEIGVARKNLEAIRSVDPEAVLFTNSWTFLDRRREDVLAYLQALPAGAFQVWEMPSDLERGQPMYQKYDYYGGKPWLVGFLFAYGGTTMLHGDLADLVRRAREAAADPRANQCRGLCLEPEAIRHNPVVFDLLSRLAWNPKDIELNSFLEDYAVRRYGSAAAPNMVRCFRELTASVYGSPGVICPLYMLRITGEQLRGDRPYGVEQAIRFLPHLQAALEVALPESERAEARALYDRDLIDIARQFLSDLFNLRTARLVRAFRARDREVFGRESAALRAILDSQEKLLSSSDEFCLSPILVRAKALPHAPADSEERIRDILTTWADHILDYAHRDYFELVRFYYRKRVEAFLAQAEANLAAGRPIVEDQKLQPVYQKIEQGFVKAPFQMAPGDRYRGTPAEAVRELLARHRLSEAELKNLGKER